MAKSAHQRENPVGAAVPLHEVSGGGGNVSNVSPDFGDDHVDPPFRVVNYCKS